MRAQVASRGSTASRSTRNRAFASISLSRIKLRKSMSSCRQTRLAMRHLGQLAQHQLRRRWRLLQDP